MDFALARGALLRLLPAPATQQLECQQTVRIEAGVDALQFQEAAEHQARSDQQHEGKGHLGHHHEVAQQPCTAERRIAAAGAQQRRDAGPRGADCRRQSEQRGRHQRRQRGEPQYGGIDSNSVQARQAGGRNGAQFVDAHPRQAQAKQRARECQQHGFRQRLAHQAPPTPAQRRADGQFPLAQRRAHQQQIGHVGASDQQ